MVRSLVDFLIRCIRLCCLRFCIHDRRNKSRGNREVVTVLWSNFSYELKLRLINVELDCYIDEFLAVYLNVYLYVSLYIVSENCCVNLKNLWTLPSFSGSWYLGYTPSLTNKVKSVSGTLLEQSLKVDLKLYWHQYILS